MGRTQLSALTVAAAEATGAQVTPTKRTVCWNTRVMYDHHQALWTPFHAQELSHCILTVTFSGCSSHDRYFPENGDAWRVSHILKDTQGVGGKGGMPSLSSLHLNLYAHGEE